MRYGLLSRHGERFAAPDLRGGSLDSLSLGVEEVGGLHAYVLYMYMFMHIERLGVCMYLHGCRNAKGGLTITRSSPYTHALTGGHGPAGGGGGALHADARRKPHQQHPRARPAVRPSQSKLHRSMAGWMDGWMDG